MSHRCDKKGKKRKPHRRTKSPSHERIRGTQLRYEAELNELEKETVKMLRKDDQKTTKSAMYWADGEAWEEIE